MSDALVISASETGREILSLDWTKTRLGSIETWPERLKATVEMMLACPTPMFLAWGPELVCFYNDAYRPVLGFRLNEALGQPFKAVWASIWSDIEPLVGATLAGRSTVTTDMKLDLARQGVSEDSWWTFTYSPVFGDDGEVCGLFCVTGETTGRVLAEKARFDSDTRLELAMSAGNSIGVWDWDVERDWVTSDTRFSQLYGVDRTLSREGAPIGEFFKGIHPDDLPRVQTEIQEVIDKGGHFRSEYRLMQADGSVRWVSAQGRCVYDDNGRCVRFPGVSYDITDRKTAELVVAAAKAERDFVIELTSRQRSLTDAEAIIRVSSEALGRRLNADRVGFYRVLGANRLRHGVGWANGRLEPLVGEQPISTFGRFAERSRSQGQTIVFSDSRFDEDGNLTAYSDHGVLSGICVPLMNDQFWQAGIYLHHAEVRHWSAAEVALVKEVAELTWITVERAEAMTRLAQRVDLQEARLAQVSKEAATLEESRRQAENQLRQLQKMEAVGQLTGGIAHDFNNMLAIIMGGLNLAKLKLSRGDADVMKFIDGALSGASSAAALTQRLLAFSRQQPLAPEAIEPNKLLTGLSEMLGRALGERIQLETVLGAGLWKAKADPSELENAIVNLSVNARDAMPDGGRVTIETSNAFIDEAYAVEADVRPGQYILIAVSDTGTGMAPDVMARAFDPFFTTKGVGKGTGLGLSQVFGFVRQTGGHVRIYSELGHGTTFKIYVPRFWGEEERAPVRRAAERLAHAKPGETILVVEDEDRVRSHTVDALRELGYTVAAAANGAEALTLIKSGMKLTALFTDVVMPEMTGRQLADQAVAILPDLKVIYTTGYTRNAVVHNGVLDPGTNFLAKPFSLEALSTKIRDVLDAAD